MPRLLLHVVACQLLAATCAFCQDAQTIAKRVADRYKGLAGYQVQGVFEVAGGRSSDAGALAWTVSKFQIAADKANKQRVDYKGSNFSLSVISNGSTIWTYLPEQKTYTKVDAVAEAADDDADETADAPKDDNIALLAYRLAITQFAGFDRLAKNSQIAGEQEIKTSEGKVRCWILQTTLPDRLEKDWIAQESFLVFRSEAQIKSRDLTTKLTISIKRFDPEPPAADQFAFTPGRRTRL